MKRSILWVCALLLITGQTVAVSRAAAQAPYRNRSSAPATPDPRAANPGARASHQNVILATARMRHALRDKVNSGLVSIISGGLGDADFDEAADLAASLDRTPGHLRILPVVGHGALQDVTDVVLARGIDLGIIQSDVLAAFRRHPPFPGVERYLQYITRLYDEEVHILAGKEIHSINELANKKVNFGLRDSGTYFTASSIFRTLGIPVKVTNFSQPVALEKLRMGEISAMVDVVGKPSRLFQNVRPDESLHFLSIPAASDLTNTYTSASLTAKDYPELIEMDKPLGTVAVGTVLITYNWPPGTERYRNVAHFVRTFFEQLRVLRAPPHQPEWRDVDLTAEVPGWTRFAPAEQWIQKAELDERGPHRLQRAAAAGTAGSSDPRQIDALLAEYGKRQRAAAGGARPIDLGQLFADFANYQKQQGAASVTAGSLNPRRIDALLALFADFAEHRKQQASSRNSGKLTLQLPAREARQKFRREKWPG